MTKKLVYILLKGFLRKSFGRSLGKFLRVFRVEGVVGVLNPQI